MATEPTFALISRFMTTDIPYLREWAEYYVGLGIDHFYLYYVDTEYMDHLVPSLNPTTNLSLQRVDPRGRNINRVLCESPFSVREDFVLHIDSDEFLWLDGMTLRDFVKTHPDYAAYRFQWLMCPYRELYSPSLNSILADPKNPRYFVPMTKMMARRDRICFGEDSHAFLPRGEEPFVIFKAEEEPQQRFFVIHFCYRGLIDLYNRTVHTQLITHRVDPLMILDPKQSVVWGKQIPSRVLGYLGAIQNSNTPVPISIQLPIQSGTDVELLQSFSYKSLDTFIRRVKYLERLEIYRNHTLGRNPKVGMIHANSLKHTKIFWG